MLPLALLSRPGVAAHTVVQRATARARRDAPGCMEAICPAIELLRPVWASTESLNPHIKQNQCHWQLCKPLQARAQSIQSDRH